MEMIVQQGGTEVEVKVREVDELLEVTVGETVYRIDVAEIGGGGRSLLIDGAQHEVSALPLVAGRYWITTAEGDSTAEVIDPLTHLARSGPGGSGGAGRQQVTAYMPGRVVSILVAEGDEVEAGQGVMVLEAMKMENEIVSERAGKVKALLVESGQAVEGGDPLFEIE